VECGKACMSKGKYGNERSAEWRGNIEFNIQKY